METKNPKRKGHKRKREEGRHTMQRRNAALILAVFGLVLGTLGIWKYREYIHKKEALEAAWLQAKWESEVRTAEKPAQMALKALGALKEVKSRTRNEELVKMLPPAGIQEFFLRDEYLFPEDAQRLMEEGEISEKKAVEEVLMMLTVDDLPTDGRTGFLTIENCLIDEENTAKVRVGFSVPYVPVSDDDYYYLFELAPYETEHGDGYVDKVSKWKKDAVFSFPLNYDSASSRLCSKFVAAVLIDGRYVDVSRGHYITNPEAVAKYTAAGESAASIKGLIVDPAKLSGKEIEDLGVKHAAYNIPIGYILGETSNALYPTVHYTYNGKTYAFNGQRIAEFDLVFSSLSKKGVVTTAVLLNDRNGAYPQLIHPDAGGGSAPYYMFNAANKEGCEYLEAVAAFLANRYSGSKKGKISNWVIGNEVNARAAWNYMDYTSVEEYAKEYANAFRIFYNGIKSVNASANVYISLDQLWNRNLDAKDAYDAKDMLDAFNADISLRGNIDWGLAHHPYPVPLTWPKFWAMPAQYASMKLVQNSVDTPYITVQNIHVLTDYMQRSELLSPNGEVRSVAVTEVGFGSDHGEELQAAAYAYAYKIAANNPHIDMFILNKQADMAVEIAQGLSLGINRSNGSHKYIYNVFKYIDTSSGDEITEFAKSHIGISSWSEVIR